ncbi:helix-turn-helix domain-containing protein [Salinicoccus roseus]|uniref:helix-turn-helix domain-containing protein n=1 Tax=Salinicoccus roseus TaxID=45670 RepID=UPI003523A383
MFSKNLTKLRKRANLTQYQLADKLGFSRGQIANYEQGKREPDYETLGKIADFFDIGIDELLGRQPKEKDIFDDADALMFSDKEGFENLSEEEKEEIRKMLEDQLEYWIDKKRKDK